MILNFYPFILSLCILGTISFSCSTPAKVTTSRDFALTKETRVAIRLNTTDADGRLGFNLSRKFEVALLDVGFNVVPMEVMLNKNYTDISISNQNNSTTGTISTYRAKYVPADIIISVQIGGAREFGISVIDLKDERLLANFNKYQAWSGGDEKRIKKFIKDLSVFVER